MSVRAMTWAFQQTGIASPDKFVLVALADNATDAGFAWPSITRLAIKTSQDRRTVIRALDRLEVDGWIRDTGSRAGRTKSIKMYQLKWSEESSDKNATASSSDKLNTASGRSSDKNDTAKQLQFCNEAVADLHEAVAFLPREPSVEPPVRTTPLPSPLRGDSRPSNVLISDPVQAKRLICKLILNDKNPDRPWSYEAQEALARQVPIPFIEIQRVAWFRHLPEDPKVPELVARKAITESGLMAYWGDEVTRANAFWVKTHPVEIKKNDPPLWRELLRWKYGPDIVLPAFFEDLDVDQRREYERDYDTFSEARAK